MTKITTINDSEVDITNKVMSWLNSTPSVQSKYENSKYL